VFCGWEPPRFQLCWEKHGKLLPEALGLTAKRVAKWSTEEVAFDNSRKVHLYFKSGPLNVFIFNASYLTMLFSQVSSFVRGLPGCREHAATFRKEVNN